MASSLFDALAAGAPEKKEELGDMMSGEFAKKVDKYKDMIVDACMRNGIDVNKSIARIAEKENLNDDQISRIVEEVNNQLYLLKYNQMKSSPEREVTFDIASLPKIKGIIKSGESNKPINQQKEASSIESAFEKTASWENNAGDDSLNFLNCSAYEIGGLDLADSEKRKAQLIKLASEKVASLENTVNEELQKYAETVYTISEALIKYDRASADAQGIFERMCKEASVRKADQIAIKDGITQKIAQLKEYRVIPSEYDFNVDLVDIDKVANEFSLGKYSLLEKMAHDTISNQQAPVVVTDKKTIKSVNHLIGLAGDMVHQKQHVTEGQKQLTEAKNKLEKK